jgi:hypothetical protein
MRSIKASNQYLRDLMVFGSSSRKETVLAHIEIETF